MKKFSLITKVEDDLRATILYDDVNKTFTMSLDIDGSRVFIEGIEEELFDSFVHLINQEHKRHLEILYPQVLKEA